MPSKKVLRVTVEYTRGETDYSVTQDEISVTAALLEITKKSTQSFLKPKALFASSKITFTFYASEDGKVFPFFFGGFK